MFEGASNLDESVIERAVSRMAFILGGLAMLLFVGFAAGLVLVAAEIIARVM